MTECFDAAVVARNIRARRIAKGFGTQEELAKKSGLSPQAISSQFALTEREAEVLQAMVTSRQSVQDLARTLCLSRTAFYRHVASMNAKTGTANRVELMHFFFDWAPGPQDGTSDQR